MFKIIFVSLIFFVFVHGDDIILTSQENMILKTVMRVDGYIDEELYNEFWKELRPRVKKSDLNEVRQLLLDNAMNIHVIVWSCLKQSIHRKESL